MAIINRTDETRRAVESALRELTAGVAYDAVRVGQNRLFQSDADRNTAYALYYYAEEIMTIIAAGETRS